MRSPLHFIETICTADRVIEFIHGGWASYRVKPPGAGWTILRDRERSTTWTRRRLVIRPTVRLQRRWFR